MDPQATWNEMLEAVSLRDWEEAGERAESLLGWMRRGGVPPQTAEIVQLRQWNRPMAEFGCLLTLQLVKSARARQKRKG